MDFAKLNRDDMAYHPYDRFYKDVSVFPLTFVYEGKKYRGFGDGFVQLENTCTTTADGIGLRVTLAHPEIPAKFIVESAIYADTRATEMVAYIKNDSNADTGVFSEVKFEFDFAGENPVLKSIAGDVGGTYIPYEKDLARYGKVVDTSVVGRPSHVTFPYYNLNFGDNGKFIAVGWPGTYTASFEYDAAAKTTHVEAGQYKVATVIRPGETFRTPRIALVEYKGLDSDGQINAWRRYFIKNVLRKVDGELPRTLIGHGDICVSHTTQGCIEQINSYAENGAPLECYWLDAGWYTNVDGGQIDQWCRTGTLDMDTNRFPDEMESIGKLCAERGMKFVLWFEPETIRFDKDTFVKNQEGFKNEWLLGETFVGSWLQGHILDLGNPEALDWAWGKISKIIEKAGVTIYRQDFNNDPAPAWEANDTADRIGMTENLYIQGYLELWDRIIERFPYITIDSCASGGGRNDLETMRRAIILQYTDWFDGNPADSDMKARMSQAAYCVFPYFRNSAYSLDPAHYRLGYSPFMTCNLQEDSEAGWEMQRQLRKEYALVRDYFYSEYYNLFEITTNPDRWNGWEFYDAEKKSGFATLYCAKNSTELTRNVRLKGLDADKLYSVKDFDGLVSLTAKGEELMSAGFDFTVPKAHYCDILLINEVE